MTSTTMTVRLDAQLKNQLQKLAEATHRSCGFLAMEAIADYLKKQTWQIREIKKGIAEADAGELLEHQVVAQHWKKKYAHSMDQKRAS